MAYSFTQTLIRLNQGGNLNVDDIKQIAVIGARSIGHRQRPSDSR